MATTAAATLVASLSHSSNSHHHPPSHSNSHHCPSVSSRNDRSRRCLPTRGRCNIHSTMEGCWGRNSKSNHSSSSHHHNCLRILLLHLLLRAPLSPMRWCSIRPSIVSTLRLVFSSWETGPLPATLLCHHNQHQHRYLLGLHLSYPKQGQQQSAPRRIITTPLSLLLIRRQQH